MIAVLVALALTAQASPAPATKAPPNGTKRVEIDGRTYRVTVRGKSVEVADKAAFTMRSPESAARMRRAVVDVTGCRMEDGYWQATVMQGTLACDLGR